MDTVLEYGPVILTWALVIIGGASTLAAGIAPLTETKWDDKLAGFLSKLKNILDKLALNPKP